MGNILDYRESSDPPQTSADGAPVAGDGVDGKLLGVLQRTDVNGERSRNVRFIAHPTSTTVGNQPGALRVRQHATLGTFLTDDVGKTRYLFMRHGLAAAAESKALYLYTPDTTIGNTKGQDMAPSGT